MSAFPMRAIARVRITRDSGAVRLREFTKLGEASTAPVKLNIRPGDEITIKNESEYTRLIDGGYAEIIEEQSR